jgi:hypothetical protein
MNRIKVFVPIGFLDQYADKQEISNIVASFLTQIQSELIVRDMGISLFVNQDNAGVSLTVRDMGISLFVKRKPGEY